MIRLADLVIALDCAVADCAPALSSRDRARVVAGYVRAEVRRQIWRMA